MESFDVRGTFFTGSEEAGIYRITALEDMGLCRVDSLPYSIRVLLESVLRNCDGFEVTEEDVKKVASWSPNAENSSGDSLQTGSGDLARFHRCAGRR